MLHESYKTKTYEYPIGISKSDNAFYKNRKVVFMAIEGQSLVDREKFYYDSKANAVNKDYEEKVHCLITLPLPNDLSDNQTHQWSDTTYLDAITGILGSTMDSMQSTGDASSGQAPATSSSRTSAIGDIVLSLQSGLGAVTDMIGVRKPMINPGYFQNYERSVLRSFSFEYTFIPKSKEEARQICEIVRAFKQYSSPQKLDLSATTNLVAEQVNNLAGGTAKLFSEDTAKKINSTMQEISNKADSYIKDIFGEARNITPFQLSPFIWHIVICNDLVRELSQIRACACSNVSVKYGTGNFDTFEDGMPKVITLSLELKEMDLQYFNKYKDANLAVFSSIKEVESDSTETYKYIHYSTDKLKKGITVPDTISSEDLKYGGGTY